MLYSWWSALPAILVGALMLTGPGLLALQPLGLRPLARFALAGPLSVAFLSAAGLLSGFPGVRYLWPEPFALAALLALLLAWAVRRRHGRHAARPTARRPAGRLLRRRLLLTACWSASVIAFALLVFSKVHSPEQFSQTYDNVFHLNATESILATGNASTLHLRTLTEPMSQIAMYPAAWHTAAASVVQITHLPVTIAFNGLALAVAAAIWIPGVAWLSAMLVPLPQRTATTAGALLLATATGFYPASLLIWGVLYPMYLAVSLIPAGVGLVVILLRETTPRWGRSRELDPHPRLTLAIAGPLWVLGAFCAHPRSLISALMVALPLLIWTGWRALRGLWRTRPELRRRILWIIAGILAGGVVLAGALVAFVYVHYDLARRPISDHLTGVQARPTETIWGAILQVVSLSAPTGAPNLSTWPLLPLAVVLLICAGWVLVTRQATGWLVWAYLWVGTLYVLAAGSNSDAAKVLTGMWYKDRFRLSALLPVLVVPLVSTTLPRLCARTRWPQAIAWGTSAVLAFSSWMTIAPSIGQGMRVTYRLPAKDSTTLVDGQQAALLRQLPALVPRGQRVLGDPWNGSSLSWVLGDREPVFPHLSGAWTPDQITVATRLDRLGTDPAVCAALTRLHVRYVLDSPRSLNGGGDPAEAQYASIHRAAEEHLMTPMRRSGSNVLYRIDRCRK
ncbi:MAG: hypothetical protein LKF98_05700 [Microbacteriaceae bacterium]|jgi:hypothetical protein|nr:hypothetical protein [Microbacteriaceae bacterium]